MREDKWVKRLAEMTPDKDPSYQKLADGRWLLHGKVYPVPKPPLGTKGEKCSPSS